jgi:hypothetical protein
VPGWRSTLPTIWREAAAKHANAVFQVLRVAGFYDCFAADREQAVVA